MFWAGLTVVNCAEIGQSVLHGPGTMTMQGHIHTYARPWRLSVPRCLTEILYQEPGPAWNLTANLTDMVVYLALSIIGIRNGAGPPSPAGIPIVVLNPIVTKESVMMEVCGPPLSNLPRNQLQKIQTFLTAPDPASHLKTAQRWIWTTWREKMC